ncbi:CYTH domain-containing protein [Candidatus Woesearchaeota archaeon]|nr:CYTH domain-containing protein [Candidatus Woesearchaeota archaeon]
MHTEFELRILDIDVADIKKKLEAIGAKKVAERNMRRYVYDFNDNPDAWLRLRDTGEKVELTIKEIQSETIDGTKELEVDVSDFDTTADILEKLGFIRKAMQENKRVSYKKGVIDFEIDFWPRIPPYFEIEAPSKEAVEAAVEALGFTLDTTTAMGNQAIYAHYGIDLKTIKELKF